MKYLLSLVMLCIVNIAMAQSGTMRLYVTLQYDEATPFANRVIYLKNKKNEVSEELRTDFRGKFSYKAVTGINYELQLKEGEPFQTINIPKRGGPALIKTFTVNQIEYPVLAESDTIYQMVSPREQPTGANGIAEIFIGDRNRKAVRGIEVRLFDEKTKKTYIATTTNGGKAFFLVPIGRTYAVGIEHINRYKVIKMPNEKGVYFETGFLFIPTNITENRIQDTIKQELPTTVSATSARAYLEIFVKDYNGNPLPNEQIALNPRNDSLTYITTTNARGIAKVLLPTGKQYVLHFYYERNIDLLDFRVQKGLHTSNVEFTYIGTQAIQDYFAQADRDMNGFVKEFKEIPIQKAYLTEKDYLELTDDGFNINFQKDKGAINSPTITNGKLYTSAGYYSDDLFVFDEKTGKFLWGISLSEGGPSSIVYEDGMILIITESCTLYAIDAESGALAWSKYLSPYMYSTPSVANGKVVATYPNGLALAEDFIMGCFDLKTGAILWQQQIKGEAIAAPVIAGEKIYTATSRGMLYQHELKDGNRLQGELINVVTPPTIVNTDLYVGIQNGAEKQQLVKLNNDDFSKKEVLNHLSTAFEGRSKNAFKTMSYDGIRPMHANGKNYNILNKELVCSSTNGEILWKTQLKGTTEKEKAFSMPVFAGNTIVVAFGDYVQLFDAEKGTSIRDYKIEGEALTQPIIHDGVIYTGTHEQRVVTIDTRDASITGWLMWGGNGSHNTVK